MRPDGKRVAFFEKLRYYVPHKGQQVPDCHSLILTKRLL